MTTACQFECCSNDDCEVGLKTQGFCFWALDRYAWAIDMCIPAWDQLFRNLLPYRLLFYRFCLYNSLLHAFDKSLFYISPYLDNFSGGFHLRERRMQEALLE